MRNRIELRAFYCPIFLTLLLCFVASCSSKPDVQQEVAQDKAQSADLVAQADKLYSERADLAKARQGIALLRRATTLDTSSYEAAWRLARLDYFLGDHTKDKTERDRAFSEGVEMGRRAVKLQDQKPEGHFWLAANLGGQAENSTLSGLTTVDEIRTEMERVIQLDEGYEAGSAYMALGQLYLEAPKMLGGDSKRAVEVLEKGARFGQENELYHLQLAKAYKEVKRTDDARRELNTVLNMKPDPNYLP
ncbi:MAG: TRAP transporter TatT component family protein, partial [Acidobacteriota bacterium]|nr:TRAP transporter TatT component family protein [Acidobacteriota bacterium]